MAVLSEAQRDRVWKAFARKISHLGWEVSFSKIEGRQAVGEMDDAVESGFSTINAALNTNFATTASTEQKALMYAFLMGIRTGGAFDPPDSE